MPKKNLFILKAIFRTRIFYFLRKKWFKSITPPRPPSLPQIQVEGNAKQICKKKWKLSTPLVCSSTDMGDVEKSHKATFHRIVEFLSWKAPRSNGPVLCVKCGCPEEANRKDGNQAGTLLVWKVIAFFSQNDLIQCH